ncbi:hypothetical protein D5b_00297 [Faustovirus]|nr:hypothetical protein D5b_00297 [Faustovirus]AMN84615.1 hypothetical protein D6_00212 [Faustovirus]AMP44245.1 hypothetical protein PRJ_Dakar_00290 [Faustovirus]
MAQTSSLCASLGKFESVYFFAIFIVMQSITDCMNSDGFFIAIMVVLIILMIGNLLNGGEIG